MQTGNTIEAEKLVSVNSRRNFLDQKDQLMPIDTLDNSDVTATVKTTIASIDADDNITHSQTFDTILVLQQGQWKIDADRTPMPASPEAKEKEREQLAEKLSESMKENIESIDEAMTQGMHLLNEALQDGSKEMGDSLLKLMNELNSTMKESIDKMKQRRQQQLDEEKQNPQDKPSPPQPDPRQGEGMI